MLRLVLRRLLYMVPTLVLISIIVFVIIQLPPGDYLTSYVANLQAQGQEVDAAQLAALEQRYGLDRPFVIQYLEWMEGILLHGDFGQSFTHSRAVSDLVWERLPLTVLLTTLAMLFVWALALPVGVYSAVRQYSLGDYLVTALGFLGLAVPNFLLALVLMYLGMQYLGLSPGGLFSPEYVDAAWNLGKVLDLLGHLWIPVVVLGTAGTAGLIRILRANLLDELRQPYVVASRARGVPERRLLLKYPVRVAMNPFVSTVGWTLPVLVSGEVIVSTVLGLDTVGPLLLQALLSQDMYLAGSIILVVSTLTVVGTLISDLLLGWLDPRVRLRYR